MSGFTKVPNSILRDPSLSLQAKGLWALMRSKPEGWNFNARQLATETENGKNAIQRYLNELIKAGYVRRHSRQADGHIPYSLHEEPETEIRAKEPQPRNASDPKSLRPKMGLNTKTVLKQDCTIRKTVVTPKAHGESGKLSLEVEEAAASRFDEYWRVYPKKVAKAVAQKAWKRHKCDSLWTAIITSVRKYSESEQWKRDAGQYIPNPATFLNQRRWEDELPQQNLKNEIENPVKAPMKPDWLILKELKARLNEIAQIKSDTKWGLAPHAYLYEDDPVRIEARKEWSAWRNGIIAEEKQIRAEIRRLQGDAA